MKPGSPEKMEFEYVRHGTQASIAFFVVQSGEVVGKTYSNHTRYGFYARGYQYMTFILSWTTSGKTKEIKELVRNKEDA